MPLDILVGGFEGFFFGEEDGAVLEGKDVAGEIGVFAGGFGDQDVVGIADPEDPLSSDQWQSL
ncbi:MAG: hypothetical protein ACLFTB_08945 [Desulfovibrionales bacterium]